MTEPKRNALTLTTETFDLSDARSPYGIIMREVEIPERWDSETTKAFIDELLVPGTSIPDIIRGLLLVVENLAMKAIE